MLNCELCNYYKSLQANNEAGSKNSSVCELVNFTFNKDIEELDIEYPCFDFHFK
jgi:hypothetical protein